MQENSRHSPSICGIHGMNKQPYSSSNGQHGISKEITGAKRESVMVSPGIQSGGQGATIVSIYSVSIPSSSAFQETIVAIHWTIPNYGDHFPGGLLFSTSPNLENSPSFPRITIKTICIA